MQNPTLTLTFAAALLLLQGVFDPVVADENAEQQFSRYQQAIEVTKQCRQIGFSDGEYDRMGEIINKKVNHEVGAKRLSLLLAAQKDARKLVEAKGCDSSEAGELLQIYDTELK
ncbi:hypothetical protein [Pelagibius sp. Alg239-R121]|uniref:hypothetical protein n=1 Tax=Pelagibius sp. Alg239-R121 TaxID=2993448 RepID=UPI0024A63242|nr:hypothetical protein [Pelagibius sp. Alg239-R121]